MGVCALEKSKEYVRENTLRAFCVGEIERRCVVERLGEFVGERIVGRVCGRVNYEVVFMRERSA